MNFIFSSCGNDSVALIQWVIENEKDLSDYTVVYSDTGWAMPRWYEDRVIPVKAYTESKGLVWKTLESEGMEALVKRKKGWPMPASPMQFCTQYLKIKPAMDYMDLVDPDKDGVCYVGVRREESTNRRNFPEYVEESDKHGGRSLHAPLVRHTEEDRDVLISRAGFDVLPHSSMECFPCINANKKDLLMLEDFPDVVDKIDRIETEMGYTRNNKPRVMFRPYHKMGATGIREVLKWSKSARGKYEPPSPCDSGFCGN